MKKIFNKLLFVTTLTVSVYSAQAQNVGINTPTPDASAALDVVATDRGVLIPRLALTATGSNIPVAAPATSLLVYNTATVADVTPGFYYWDGAQWVRLSTNSGTDDQNLTGATLAGTTLTIDIESGTSVAVDLAALQDGVNDADSDPTNEYNTNATLAGTVLTITDAGGNQNVDLASIRRDAENGLYIGATGAVRLGTNPLIEHTTITQAGFNMMYDLTGTGDFHVQDNGVNKFSVLDNGDVNADAGTFFVDESTNRVGIGTTTPDDKLDVNGDIVLTGGVRNIEIQAGDQNIQLDDANPTWNGDSYGGITRFLGDANLSRSKLEAGGLQLERRIQIKGGAPGVGKVLTSDATGNATWETPTIGDITGVTAGVGLTGGGNSGTVTLNVVAINGLTDNANDIRLGGSLIQATTITQGIYDMVYNLNSTGEFRVQDNGTTRFHVLNTGRVELSANIDASGSTNTGSLEIGNALRLDANEIITNTNTALYLQNDNNGDLIVDNPTLIVDASDDVVRMGSATGSLSGNGTTVTGVTVDYVSDCDNGTATGTATGIGSIEYLLDGSARTTINNEFDPTTHINKDLGWSTTAEGWDDVYADAFVNISDEREKANIKDMTYGLKEIMQMRTISYVLKKDPFQDPKIGLVAQNVLTLVPEAVKTHDNKILDEAKPNEFTRIELERMGMEYMQIVPVLIKATQEQQAQIEDLKKEIATLKADKK